MGVGRCAAPGIGPAAVIPAGMAGVDGPDRLGATADPADEGTMVKAIEHFVYRAHSLDKVEMLSRILQAFLYRRGPAVEVVRQPLVHPELLFRNLQRQPPDRSVVTGGRSRVQAVL